MAEQSSIVSLDRKCENKELETALVNTSAICSVADYA